MIKRFLSNIFSFLGYEVYRIRSSNTKEYAIHQSPLLIEFIGVSAVGKSVVYNFLKDKERNWYTMTEFLKNEEYQKHYNIMDDLIVYQKLAEHRLKKISERHNLFIDKFKNAHWNYQKLWEDAIVFKTNKNKQLVTDEGLLHNYKYGIIDFSVTEFYLIQDLLKNRAVVYCYTSAQIIIDRIRKREKESGRIQAGHRDKTDQELKIIIEKEFEDFNKLIIILKKYGIEVLEIDTQNDLSENVTKVNELIKKLRKQ